MISPSSAADTIDPVENMLDQWHAERPDLDVSGMAVVLRIQMLANIFRDRLKETLRPFDLQPWEFDVLSALRRAGPPYAQNASDLCSAAQLTSGAMTNRIDRLEERQLVRRSTGEDDARVVVVSLTPAGRRLVDRALTARVASAQGSTAALTEKQTARLADLLGQLF